MEETIFSVAEAADYLGVKKRTIWKWVQDGSLGCYRIGDGKYIRIGSTHLQDYLKSHEVINEHQRAQEAA